MWGMEVEESVCVCVWEREREERERKSYKNQSFSFPFPLHSRAKTHVYSNNTLYYSALNIFTHVVTASSVSITAVYPAPQSPLLTAIGPFARLVMLPATHTFGTEHAIHTDPLLASSIVSEWVSGWVRGWEGERVRRWEGEKVRRWEGERVRGWEGERVRGCKRGWKKRVYERRKGIKEKKNSNCRKDTQEEKQNKTYHSPHVVWPQCPPCDAHTPSVVL
jgi:hypothetical protein